MRNDSRLLSIIVAAILFLAGCTASGSILSRKAQSLSTLVSSIRDSVVTVINYDLNGEVASIGSGFFISTDGVLLTNFHVLDGAYTAQIRTRDGSLFPVATVLAKNQLVDLMKVRVDIPEKRIAPVRMAALQPELADAIFVMGSPMGLEQTVSEGIISAVRPIPAGGTILQLTAPISQGSSGGPVINRKGEVVGVVSFQVSRGQNLNFAISIDTVDLLSAEKEEISITEWTIRNSDEGPALAAMLCSQGARLTIRGELDEAVNYFYKATESHPEDPDAWYGLGSCYVGLDRPQDAIAAYRRPIEQDPDNATAHFVLAMYFKAIGRFEDEIASLSEVIRLEPANVRARYELGSAYGALERTPEQIDTYRTILSGQPEHMPTLIGLGRLLGDMGRLEEAMELFSRASGLEPENETIHYNMGVTYMRMDRTESAIRAYTDAIRANPRMVEAHFNLGVIYVQQELRKLALDQYEILRPLDGDAARTLFEQIYPSGTK